MRLRTVGLIGGVSWESSAVYENCHVYRHSISLGIENPNGPISRKRYHIAGRIEATL
jgi:aspartate/glutamate racemase